MNRVILVLPLIALAACSAEPGQATAPTTTPTAPATSVDAPVTAPPAPEPSADGPCPYLDDADVADANGQRVSAVRISADDPPACFFYRADGDVQLAVRIYQGEPAVATAVVDAAVPVATSNPARSPAGWQGGSLSGDDGAVYAVAKDGAAVVVTTNQEQTIKARRITETVIDSLGM
ncbi:DUF2020 domain-containing protein [Actinokineospora sp. 24-640]